MPTKSLQYCVRCQGPHGRDCPKAPAQASGWERNTNRKPRPSRHARGYGHKWVKLRQQILARDKHLCQPCRQAGRWTPATEVDHEVPKVAGGKDCPTNLRAICSQCHKAKTLIESRSYRHQLSGREGGVQK